MFQGGVEAVVGGPLLSDADSVLLDLVLSLKGTSDLQGKCVESVVLVECSLGFARHTRQKGWAENILTTFPPSVVVLPPAVNSTPLLVLLFTSSLTRPKW